MTMSNLQLIYGTMITLLVSGDEIKTLWHTLLSILTLLLLHTLGITRLNVYAGLAGSVIYRHCVVLCITCAPDYLTYHPCL